MDSQRYGDTRDIGLIETNGATPEWVTTQFWSNSLSSIVFNETNIIIDRVMP